MRTLRLDTRNQRNGSMALFFGTNCAESDDMTWQPPKPALRNGTTFNKISGWPESNEHGYTLNQLLAVRREAIEECAEMTINTELLEALKAAESSLSDYHAGAEWGAYDLGVLEEVRKTIAAAESAVSEPTLFNWKPSFSKTQPDSTLLAELTIHHPDGQSQTLFAGPTETHYYTKAQLDEAYEAGKSDAAAVSEPVARVMFNDDGRKTDNLIDRDLPVGTLLYTTPQEQKND